MKITHRLTFSILLMSLAPLPALAESWNGDRLRVSLGSFYVLAADTTIRFDSSTAIGVTLDTAQDLGMNRGDTIGRAEAYYRFNNKHSINFLWYDLKRSGTTNIDQEIEIGDPPETIPIGAHIDSYLNTAIYKVGYNYSFYHNDKVEMAVGGGLHIMAIEAGAKGELIVGDPTDLASSSSSITAPLPVVGAKLVYKITPELSWAFSTDAFFLAIGDYEGHFSDSNLVLEWRFSKHVGIGGGLNSNTLNFRASPETDNRFRLGNSITGLHTYLFMAF